MAEKPNIVVFTPEKASLSDEFDQCRELLKMVDVAHYINAEGASVMCARGKSEGNITIIIFYP